VLLALSVLAVPTARPAGAQSYPTRAVKLVVPYAAGGPNDIMARLIAQKLSASLGGQFYVENAAGAGGTIVRGQRRKRRPTGTRYWSPIRT
jgi:tripartite-type tricarboxylate transporter receptor subunit TctC